MGSIYDELVTWEKTEGKILFDKMRFRKDAQVLDYGCGYGHYSVALARGLNELGKVYAVDVKAACLKELKEKLEVEQIQNVVVQKGNKDYTLEFEDESLDVVLYYNLLHGGDGSHKKKLLEEAYRVLKRNGVLSILPFHLSNFRDDEGNKKKYTYAQLIHEVKDYGYELSQGEMIEGINFEKCHSKYQLSKGEVHIKELERAEILNFIKL
ncbi:MAG: class I SAM-dependent methyltransferase [Cellulosilyticum sp.]|nr:class I SAM-dependent methyltransferase [Cellulosilyticum sp.]